jgi:hypothetical protein
MYCTIFILYLEFPCCTVSHKSLHNEIWLLDSKFGYCKATVACDLPIVYRIFQTCLSYTAFFGQYLLIVANTSPYSSQFRYCTPYLSTVPRIWLYCTIAWLLSPARSLPSPAFYLLFPQFGYCIPHRCCCTPKYRCCAHSWATVFRISTLISRHLATSPQNLIEIFRIFLTCYRHLTAHSN